MYIIHIYYSIYFLHRTVYFVIIYARTHTNTNTHTNKKTNKKHAFVCSFSLLNPKVGWPEISISKADPFISAYILPSLIASIYSRFVPHAASIHQTKWLTSLNAATNDLPYHFSWQQLFSAVSFFPHSCQYLLFVTRRIHGIFSNFRRHHILKTSLLSSLIILRSRFPKHRYIYPKRNFLWNSFLFSETIYGCTY